MAYLPLRIRHGVTTINHMQIGTQIRKKRLALGATLEQVAFDAGIDASNLSRIERNRQQPSSALLKRIADALGANVAQLYNEKSSYSVRDEPYNAGLEDSALSRRLLKHFRTLHDEHQELVLDFVKLLEKRQPK